MNNYLPLISCVCVTRKKPAFLKRAIECFLAQTYPNKELVIVYEDDDDATAEFIASGFPADTNIRLFRVPAYPKIVLGELKNLAVRIARGDFICQWDDDDWYHIRRLEEQYSRLFSAGRHGSVMLQWLVFDSVTSTAYLSHVRLWEGSILCSKNILQLKAYEDKPLGEDTATIEYLARMNCLHLLKELPGLYIYVYHGYNAWNYDHWCAIFRCSTALSREDSGVVADILNGTYSAREGSMLLDGILEQSFTDDKVLL
jgi:glycosyltransferase involved in cell wall biosynthesis